MQIVCGALKGPDENKWEDSKGNTVQDGQTGSLYTASLVAKTKKSRPSKLRMHTDQRIDIIFQRAVDWNLRFSWRDRTRLSCLKSMEMVYTWKG